MSMANKIEQNKVQGNTAVSDSEEVSENENHTSAKNDSDTDDSDEDSGAWQRNSATNTSILSKNGEIQWKVKPPQHGQ